MKILLVGKESARLFDFVKPYRVALHLSVDLENCRAIQLSFFECLQLLTLSNWSKTKQYVQ